MEPFGLELGAFGLGFSSEASLENEIFRSRRKKSPKSVGLDPGFLDGNFCFEAIQAGTRIFGWSMVLGGLITLEKWVAIAKSHQNSEMETFGLELWASGGTRGFRPKMGFSVHVAKSHLTRSVEPFCRARIFGFQKCKISEKMKNQKIVLESAWKRNFLKFSGWRASNWCVER